MKYFVIFSFIVLLCSSALAEEGYLRDDPEGHWASEAVYDLVKRGVTSGFPDGTFQGKRFINRNEIAAFLSKLARSFHRDGAKNEKLLQELRAELALIEHQAKKQVQFSGALESRARASTTSPRGGQLDNRLKINLKKTLDSNTTLKVRIDTVDAGFNTASTRGFPANLLDVESKFKLGFLDVKANLGPGVVVHTESDEIFPSENYTIYIRPKTALKVSNSIEKLSLSASYVTRQVERSGKIGVHEFTTKVGYDFGQLAIDFRPRYLFIIDGDRDMLVEMGMNFKPSKVFETSLLLALGSLSQGQDAMYLKFIQKLKDLGGRGTNIVLRFDRAGSKYREDNIDKYEFVYLNNFNRLVLDGTTDLGFKISQALAKGFSLAWKSDYVTTEENNYGVSYPGTYFLWQLALSHDYSSTIRSQLFYRSYNVPSGTAQFSDAVLPLSDMLGLALTFKF